jgi:hypothetical protein
MTNDLRFLCDEILAGLGRWLRIAGYDTAIAARGCRDCDLVEQAHAEQRILLTRDRRLVEIRRANAWTIVPSMPAPGNWPSGFPWTGALIRSAAAPCATRRWISPITGFLHLCRRASRRLARRCVSVLTVATSIGKAATSAASAGG